MFRLQLWIPSPNCFRLLAQCILRAASLAVCTAGNSSAIRMAIIAITTSNSTKVKAVVDFRMGATYRQT